MVDNNLKNMYKLNNLPLVSWIIEDLQKWIHLPITWLGRINCIKWIYYQGSSTSFSPYRFQWSPVLLKNLNKHIRQFIWNGKTPRISIEKLTWDYKVGGSSTALSWKALFGCPNSTCFFSFWKGKCPTLGFNWNVCS